MKSYIISIAVIAQLVERYVLTLMVKGSSLIGDRILFLIIFFPISLYFCFIWQFWNSRLLIYNQVDVQVVLHTILIYWFNLPKKIPIEWSNSSPWLYTYETLQMCASFSDDVKTILKVLDWFFFQMFDLPHFNIHTR